MLTKQRLGDAADILDMKFNFERKPEFMGHKEEALRELYHWCREQERRPVGPSHTISVKYDDKDNIVSFNFGGIEITRANLGVFDAFVSVSPPSGVTKMAADLCGILRARVTAPATPSVEPVPPPASQCPEASQAAASPAG